MPDNIRSDWDPRDRSILDDQRAGYDRMRETCPVAHSDFLDWSVFRHQDIVDILDDTETYSSETKRRHVPNGMDPPEHTLYREALEPLFTSDYMDALRPRSRKIASSLLAGQSVPGDLEIMEDFAHPFTLRSLCAFVGWPEENWKFLRGWTHGNQEATFTRDREAGKELAQGYASYVQRGLDERRQTRGEGDFIEQDIAERRRKGENIGTDVISEMMRLEVSGTPLTDEQIVSVTRNWTAGHGTVASALGNIIHALAVDPDLQARLRDDASLIPTAIDEIPRTNGPLVANNRTATREVTINGRTIPEDAHLSLMWIAANRDPDAFDDADEIQLDRDQVDNLLYGRGIHYCIGAELSRLELQIAVEELLKHTSAFTLATDHPLDPQVYPANGFQELTLRLA